MLLASLLASLSTSHAQEVLVIDGNYKFSTANLVAAQLEDSLVYSFSVTLLRVSDIGSLSDLTPYDTVIFGDSGYKDLDLYDEDFIGLLEDYQESGGGVISSTWTALNAIISTVSPVETPDVGFCTRPTVLTVESSHEITDGLAATYEDSAKYTETPGQLHKGAEVLVSADCNGEGAVSIHSAPSGARQVYLGSLYFGAERVYDNANLRRGYADKILEQAVAWASECSDDDGDRVTDCGSDCDDNDPNNFPGNVESCDGRDNDCDGIIDSEERDTDADGFAPCAGDCDDTDSTTHPGAAEACDGVDNDCDTVVPGDELDGDSDGFAACAGDCDDDDPTSSPIATESCDGTDNDCDGVIDGGLDFFSVYTDADGDGYGDDATAAEACAQPSGTVLEGGDCDDTNPLSNPAGTEIADNAVDEDCDGEDLVTNKNNSPDGACAHASPGSALGFALLGGLAALSRRRRRGSVHMALSEPREWMDSAHHPRTPAP